MIEPDSMTKDQLKNLALKQRIGELTSNYEDEIAELRANFTQEYTSMQNVRKALEEQVESLQKKLREKNEPSKAEQETTTAD